VARAAASSSSAAGTFVPSGKATGRRRAGADLRLDTQVEVAVERLAERAATLTDRVPGQLGLA
jgi:hypothetical protein